MTLFTERDKCIRIAWLSEAGERLSEAPESNSSADKYREVAYVASKADVIDRLNAMGFTLEATQSVFESGIHFLRAALQASNDDANLILDLTDLVDSGYYAEQDRISENARLELSADYPANSKIIVLTEGSTDSCFLKATLEPQRRRRPSGKS